MQYILSQEDVDKLLNRLTLVIDEHGITFDNIHFRWEDIEHINTGIGAKQKYCRTYKPKLQKQEIKTEIIQGI